MRDDTSTRAAMAGSTSAASVELTGINLYYGQLHAVKDVSFTLAPGEIVALLGESGSGKSSLLRAIAGLEPITSGQITLAGRSLAGVPVHKRGIGLLFQDGQLFVHRSVGRNISYGLEVKHPGGRADATRYDTAARERRVSELLELIDMPGYQERPVTTLSGGQAQRVALARALAPRPRLLLLDEPLSALDRALREKLSTDLRQILTATGTTALYVTHDQDEAFAIADRVGIMRQGEVIALAEPFALWRNPPDVQVARFLGMGPIISDQPGEAAGAGRQRAVWPGALAVHPYDGSDPVPRAQQLATRVGFAAVITSARLGRGGVALELRPDSAPASPGRDAVGLLASPDNQGAIKATYALTEQEIPAWLRAGQRVWAYAERESTSPIGSLAALG